MANYRAWRTGNFGSRLRELDQGAGAEAASWKNRATPFSKRSCGSFGSFSAREKELQLLWLFYRNATQELWPVFPDDEWKIPYLEVRRTDFSRKKSVHTLLFEFFDMGVILLEISRGFTIFTFSKPKFVFRYQQNQIQGWLRSLVTSQSRHEIQNLWRSRDVTTCDRHDGHHKHRPQKVQN